MSRRSPPPSHGLFLSIALASLAAACSQGSSPSSGSSQPAGAIASKPGNQEFPKFIVETNEGGEASGLVIQKIVWGRLVDVFDCQSCGLPAETRQPMFSDLLIDPELETDGVDYVLVLNPANLREELTILHPFGSPDFTSALKQATSGVDTVKPKSLSPFESGFTQVARNGAMAILFNDVVADSTVVESNIDVLVGYPPVAPFELRVVPDPSHGDIVDGVFRSTRVLVDATVSPEESLASSVPVNSLGFPPAINASQGNVGIRIPTQENNSAQQFGRLENLSGHGLAFDASNDPKDPNSPTLDIVRALRSGGPTAQTGDPSEGFLPDDRAPRLLGALQGAVTSVQLVVPGKFEIDFQFASLPCAVTPRVGDLIRLVSSGVLLRVLLPGTPPVAGLASDVFVQRIDNFNLALGAFQGGLADFFTPWDSSLAAPPACYVSFNPTTGQTPGANVSPGASIRITFDEPMNPETVDCFGSFEITSPSVTVPLAKRVVGVVNPTLPLTSFNFEPAVPLSHATGQSETYDLKLTSELLISSQKVVGATDLAGNPLTQFDQLPLIPFTLDSQAPTLQTSNVSLAFTTEDEDGTNGPEVSTSGQFVYDESRGVLASRSLTRFDAWIDTSNATAATVIPTTPLGPVVEPLSIYGSRTMTVWRYHDLGMSLFDPIDFNVDVERLYWMVATTSVQLDNFPNFQLSLSHSKYLPDEIIIIPPMSPPILKWPNSGVTGAFSDNFLDPSGADTQIMAPKGAGYLINPLDLVIPPGHANVQMQPWPVNLGKPLESFTYWTWRDTAVTGVAGPNGAGADTEMNPPTLEDNYYAADAVPTIGLPMLFDFRTYPATTQANGGNLLNVTAINNTNIPNPPNPAPPLNAFNQPFFRTHSTGGWSINNPATPVLIDPDQQINASGGFDAAGIATPPVDSGFFYGGASFVTRVNRGPTIWLDLGPAGPANLITIADPVTSFSQPAGTQLRFAYRGASAVNPAAPNTKPFENGNNIDPYGNVSPVAGTPSWSVNFFNQDPGWKDESQFALLSGARFIQVRITMIGNAVTGATPELSALGLAAMKP